MQGKRRKVSFITNSILALAFAAVFAVSFYPKTAVPIYVGADISAIYSGAKGGNKVSFMFNVYENADVVEQISETLISRGVKATFFVGGCWADDNGDTLNKLALAGHEIANHGYFHKDHAALNYEKNAEEIRLTGIIVNALCGVQPVLFAPPSGSYSELTLQAAADLGYKVIMWTKDTIDWRDKDVNTVIKRATNNLVGGDLILMHPKEHTLAALPQILDFCAERGLIPVTVSENISEKITQTT